MAGWWVIGGDEGWTVGNARCERCMRFLGKPRFYVTFREINWKAGEMPGYYAGERLHAFGTCKRDGNVQALLEYA